MPQVTDSSALRSGNSAAATLNTPTFLTTKFAEAPPDFVSQVYGMEGLNTFQPINEPFKAIIREAVDDYDRNSGLIIFEISEGDADINFMAFDLTKFGLYKPGGVAAFAPYPADGLNVPYASDIYFDITTASLSNPFYAKYVAWHELGHTVGFKHGYDGDVTLAASVDNARNTIFSSETSSGFEGKLQPFDIAELQRLYGTQNQGAVQGDAGNNDMSGGAGNDHLRGNDGHDNLFGGDGSDTIEGGAGNDHIYGKSLVAGNDGNDTMLAGSGSDYIQGNMGNDFVGAEDGYDRVQGGQGNDTIYGGSGNDALNGNKGADKVYGEAGNDSLRGGQDNDYLSGGADQDSLNGDLGADTLAGGAGNDIFVFSGLGSAVAASDQVNDYVDNTDRLSVGFIPAAVLTGTAQADFQSAQNAAQSLFNGHVGNQEVAAVRVGGDSYLFYSSNGGETIDSAVKIVGADPQAFTPFDFV